MPAANGKYLRSGNMTSDGEPVFVLDNSHQLYRSDGVWRVAYKGKYLYYTQTAPANPALDGPPAAEKDAWRTEGEGLNPPPSAITCGYN